MALSFQCDKGHIYFVGDFIEREDMERFHSGGPICPECYKEWAKETEAPCLTEKEAMNIATREEMFRLLVAKDEKISRLQKERDEARDWARYYKKKYEALKAINSVQKILAKGWEFKI